MNAVWWQLIVAVASGMLIGGLTNAIPLLFHYLRQPCLKLYLEANEKKTYYIRPIAGETSLGRWVCIWAKSTPRCGKQRAIDCYSELIRIERQIVDVTVTYEEEIDFVRDRLSWAGMGGEADRGFIDHNIDKDDPLRIAVCLIREEKPGWLSLETQPTKVASGRKLSFEPGAYRITVRLYSGNAPWTERQFLLQHTGKWNQLSISDVKKEKPMKKIPCDLVTSTIICLLVFFPCLVMSILTRNVDWFVRSGPILCIVGAYLAVRRLLRIGPKKAALEAERIDGGAFDPSEEERKRKKEEDRDQWAAYYGVFITIFGIVIWAYGGVILGLVL